MTRLGPSHDEGPGTPPHIRPMLVSEFSVRIYYTTFYQCFLSIGGQIYGWGSGPMLQVQSVQLRRGQIHGCILSMFSIKRRTNLWLGQ